ncbi:DUF3987 domain-containing protein [Acinetobacter pseudolwoffii]|uniref:DUF3987 domain-containing protein n=1 Tax=Acinetobacter pseudolwoffii TaxID=2053287 RepID=UPI0025789049|nr:DUF3987 domain-containing protein [Acinetobacter pseudolwoffii]MDM1325187.1 DUF3987 domain-containing protein [Acinetobacter pseudolwoffii]
MNAKITLNAPLVVSTDPVTGNITAYHSIEDFVKGCIDEQNFKVKPESYICSKLPDYNCEECTVLPYVNPEQLSEIVGYAVKGIAKKYDTDQTPHKEIDSKEVSFLIGKAGVFASNTNNKYMPYVLGTDNIDLFVQLAKAGEAVVLHKDIDAAYQIINNGMPETIFRMMVGFNLSQQNQDLFVQVNDSFKTLPPNQIKQFLLDKKQQIIKSIESDSSVQPQVEEIPVNLKVDNSGSWQAPVSLRNDTLIQSKPYPINELPEVVREAILATTEYVQAPLAMAAQCVLASISFLAQGKVNAPRETNREGMPSSLFFLTEGGSGGRKSSCQKLVELPIREHERQQNDEYKKVLDDWNARSKTIESKEFAQWTLDNPRPTDPTSIFSDITIETLTKFYIKGIVKNASLSSDEAGQFFDGHTMKGDTAKSALGTFTKLFDDGYCQRNRASSDDNGTAYDVRLTFNLLGQRAVLASALNDTTLRGQGFLPRFILTAPESIAGQRTHTVEFRQKLKNSHNDPRLTKFWNRCRDILKDELPVLLNDSGEVSYFPVMQLSNEAELLELEFYNECEILQGSGKQFEFMQPFASRANELARRLGAVLAYFENRSEIDLETMRAACAVIRHSLSEWFRYSDIEVADESDSEKLIKYLLTKCKKEKTNLLQRTIAMKGAPLQIRKAKEFDPCLNELIEFNYVRLVTINRSAYIELNPALLK